MDATQAATKGTSDTPTFSAVLHNLISSVAASLDSYILHVSDYVRPLRGECEPFLTLPSPSQILPRIYMHEYQ